MFIISCAQLGLVLNYLTAEKIGENPVFHGVISLPCWSCVGSLLLRLKMREYLGMEEKTIYDVLSGLFCICCVQCQLYNEVKERGL